MNKPIRNLYLVVVGLFALLLGYTSWWTVFNDEPLRTSAQNNRDLIRAERVPRGKIIAADGTVLARAERDTPARAGGEAMAGGGQKTRKTGCEGSFFTMTAHRAFLLSALLTPVRRQTGWHRCIVRSRLSSLASR